MLHHAVSRVNDAAVVCETLVACGSEIDATYIYGDTPLMWAVQKRRADVVRLFLALNADTTKTDDNGWDVSQTDNAQILRLLSKHSKKTVSPISLHHFV